MDENSIFRPKVTTQTDSSVFTRSGEIKKVTLCFEHRERLAEIFFRFLYTIYLWGKYPSQLSYPSENKNFVNKFDTDHG